MNQKIASWQTGEGETVSFRLGENSETLTLERIRLLIGINRDEYREREFEGGTINFGSEPYNDVVLDDPHVSRSHCRIYPEGNAFVVQDLDSKNGTFVDGVRVQKAFLEKGSIVKVGEIEIEVDPGAKEIELEPVESTKCGQLIGTSTQMRRIFALLERIAPTDSTVVVEGETGTGKEVVARSLHELSARAEEPFVVFDCGAVPRDLAESEMFGHEEGSFTGAKLSREGLFERADGGTVFLDEIADLPLDLQSNLLRVLEEGEIRRVGGNDPISVDVRVVAATNQPLSEQVDADQFREDLFYRLNVVRFELPPLRDRIEDLPLLVSHILETHDFNFDRNGDRIIESASDEVLASMRDYDWPGNVRELVNVLERAASFISGDELDVDSLPKKISGIENPWPSATLADDSEPETDVSGSESGEWSQMPSKDELHRRSFKEAKERWVAIFERDYLVHLLVRHDGNISRAAEEAELSRTYLYKLLEKHDIDPERLGDSSEGTSADV